jgi:hypothetical protein
MQQLTCRVPPPCLRLSLRGLLAAPGHHQAGGDGAPRHPVRPADQLRRLAGHVRGRSLVCNHSEYCPREEVSSSGQTRPAPLCVRGRTGHLGFQPLVKSLLTAKSSAAAAGAGRPPQVPATGRRLGDLPDAGHILPPVAGGTAHALAGVRNTIQGNRGAGASICGGR